MPWNDNSGGGGPWGSGGGSNNNNPWGQGPNKPGNGRGPGGGGNEPDLEELVRRFQAWLGGLGGGGKGGGGGGKGGNGAGGGAVGLIAAAAVVVFAVVPGNLYYVVGADQAGVVLRFGEYDRTTTSGLNFKLPWPVENVLLPAVTTTNEVEVGTIDAESLMITRDENIVDVDFVVQWRVDLTYENGVRDFLFNVRDPEGTVKAVAESAMREVVGTSELQPIITTGRAEAARRARDIIQDTLNSYQAGIQILEVQLSESSAPANVIDAFRDVDAARQDATQVELQAQRTANQIIPEARGEAARMLEEARGYRERVIAEAQGNADRFNSIYTEYALAPDVTRQRMFFETMERVLGRSELIILDQRGNGAVPYLPLDQLGRNRGPAATASGTGQGGN